jgi:hypothetical protein
MAGLGEHPYLGAMTAGGCVYCGKPLWDRYVIDESGARWHGYCRLVKVNPDALSPEELCEVGGPEAIRILRDRVKALESARQEMGLLLATLERLVSCEIGKVRQAGCSGDVVMITDYRGNEWFGKTLVEALDAARRAER